MHPVGTNSSQVEVAGPNQNPSSGITVLPQELLERIFKSLPPKNQSFMAQTCKKFHEISKLTFIELKQQVLPFLKRILGTKLPEDIKQRLDNSNNFAEFSSVINDRIWPIECDMAEEFKPFRLLLPQAINTSTQLKDLSPIELLHEILEVSPIFFISDDFYSRIPQETVDRLVDMLIEKHGLEDTLKFLKRINPPLNLIAGPLKHSRKLLQYAHQKNAEWISIASDRLKDDRNFILKMIKEWTPLRFTSPNKCCAFRYASDRLKNDKDVVLAAVSKDGHSLEFASDRQKGDRDVLLAALLSDLRLDNMTELVPQALRNDPVIKKLLILQYTIEGINEFKALQKSHGRKLT